MWIHLSHEQRNYKHSRLNFKTHRPMKTKLIIEKKFRTQEQFESIAENCLNGNWTEAANECIEYGFYANDLRRFNEELNLFDDLYDIALLAEMAQKLRK